MRVVAGHSGRYVHTQCQGAYTGGIVYMYMYIQWNPSNLDTLGTEESVVRCPDFRVVYAHERFGTAKTEVSCLLRCPRFRVS